MNHNQKQTIRYTGICYTISDNTAIVESYGSDKTAVLEKTLAAALCFGETRFSIVASLYQRPVILEHFTIADPKTGQYRATSKATLPYMRGIASLQATGAITETEAITEILRSLN
jgi:hypothetical protein